MGQVNLFLLLPETDCTNQWMRSTEEHYYEVKEYEGLIRELKNILKNITIENYQGYFDGSNIENFFKLYNTLDDCYPSPPKKFFRSIIRKNAFINWREEASQRQGASYKVFHQVIENHVFCEVAERTKRHGDDHNVLVNHGACTIHPPITVTIDDADQIEIPNLEGSGNVVAWFIENRIPSRQFHIIPKHGESRQGVRNINGETVSPLRCTCGRAQSLLHHAIGNSDRELYNIDPDHGEIIVFKYEGHIPQNTYHGYHVPRDSKEVPSDIRKRLIDA